MKPPIISVVMSVYNGEKYVSEAIDSILNQTFTDFEFIVTNDGSTDKTPIILNKYAENDSRIIVIHQENAGLTESLNKMIAKAKGTFIARMDADDISLPERFEKQINKLLIKSVYLAVGCWFQMLDESGRSSYEIVFPDNPILLKRYFRKGINSYAHGSVMIRKKVFDKVGFSYRFKYGQDLDLWLRLSEHSSLGIVEEVLYQRRDHRQVISNTLIPRRSALKKLMLILTNERKKYGKETSNWREEERRIFKNIPLWTEKEINAYNKFLEARSELCAGKNAKAHRLLLSIKNELNNFIGFLIPYYISCLPGFLTCPVLRLRDRINNKRYFRHNLNNIGHI